MSKNLTECDTVDKKTTHYIQRNITQRFIDTWVELSDRKVPPQLILQGLSIALAGFTIRVKETQGSEKEIGQILSFYSQYTLNKNCQCSCLSRKINAVLYCFV